jgi:hypothetical protein
MLASRILRDRQMQSDKVAWLREWLVPPIVLPILIGLLVASVALFR